MPDSEASVPGRPEAAGLLRAIERAQLVARFDPEGRLTHANENFLATTGYVLTDVLGGNQSDSVSIVRIESARLVAVRRSPFKIAQPANVRPVVLARTGALSTNEA